MKGPSHKYYQASSFVPAYQPLCFDEAEKIDTHHDGYNFNQQHSISGSDIDDPSVSADSDINTDGEEDSGEEEDSYDIAVSEIEKVESRFYDIHFQSFLKLPDSLSKYANLTNLANDFVQAAGIVFLFLFHLISFCKKHSMWLCCWSWFFLINLLLQLPMVAF